MKVIICGGGQVGYNIAKQLSEEHNDVTVIDQSADRIQDIRDTLDVQAIIGHASNPDLLEQAGAEDAEMIIAVTFSDEVNMVACQIAHSLFGVPTKIARIRAQSYLRPHWANLFIRDNLPIDVIISPEIEVARAINRRLQVPGTFEIVPFAEDAVRVIGVHLREDCPVVDTPLRQLTELFPGLHIFVVGIVRDGTTIVPSGDDQLQIEDDVYFIVEREHTERAVVVFGHEETEARRILIFGGGNVGLFIAQEIEAGQQNVTVKIIEPDKARAEFIADQLKNTVVIQGDALDPSILSEANVQETETVIVVTNDDEANILASLLAKQAGCDRVITLINNPNYGSLVSSLGIDVVIDPRVTTVSTILQHVRRGRIKNLHSLSYAGAEIIEAEVLETSRLANTRIRDAHFPEGIIIGAIIRDGKVILPRGDTVIEVRDRVVLFALAKMVRAVEQMFSVRLDFF